MAPCRLYAIHKRIDTLTLCVEYVQPDMLRGIYLIRYSSLGVERVRVVLLQGDCVGEFLGLALRRN